MSEFKEIINSRRSCRAYKPDMVPQELIDEVVDAGLKAACGKGAQSSVIITVTDPEMREKISQANRQIMGVPTDPFYGAPVILVVIADKSVPTAPYDGACSLENMMLMAQELGLGSCWIHRCKQEFEGELGKEILAKIGLEGDFEGVGHLALGYKATDEVKPKEIKAGRSFKI